MSQSNKIVILFTLLASTFIFPLPSYAQTVQTQKQVISNFKADTTKYFPFPESNCSEKFRGDANCDNLVDEFDLSIWQVEIQNPDGIKRADFNNDGTVSLVDYGIWKNTYYPNEFANSGVQKYLSWIFKIVSAQQPNDTQQIRRSLPVTFAGGDSMVFNTNLDGSTSQIAFDRNSNPISALLLNTQGAFQAESSFLNGEEIVSTIQDGVVIQTIKKADGPVIQSFKDQANNLLAVKSWPSLASLEAGEPPLAVTVPTRDGNLMTLNISPNGTGIVIQTDGKGNILNQAQYKNDGTYLSEDNRFNIRTSSNDKIGLSTIEISNNLGGKTTYNFYKSGLYAIVQTDKNNNYYIAKPTDATGDSWSLSSTVNGQVSESTTQDPVAQINGGTPSPKEILANINYYKSLPSPGNIVNFQDGFGISAQIPPALIAQGNDILKVQTIGFPSSPEPQAVSSSFFIKEALAQTTNPAATAASAASLAPSTATGSQVNAGIGSNNSNVTVGADGSQTTTITNSGGAQIASSLNSQSGNSRLSADNNVVNTIASVITSNVRTNYGTTPVGRPEEMKGPTTCFLAGTLISTPNGPKAIETLKPGDKVYSYNEKTGKKEISNFKELDINFVDEYLIINGKIHTTNYHPFYVIATSRSDEAISNSYGLLSLVKAGKLKIGDYLIDESGTSVLINSIQKVTAKTTVYNLLTVTPNDNFYAEGILVHNYNNDMGDDKSNGETSGGDGNNSISSDPMS